MPASRALRRSSGCARLVAHGGLILPRPAICRIPVPACALMTTRRCQPVVRPFDLTALSRNETERAEESDPRTFHSFGRKPT